MPLPHRALRTGAVREGRARASARRRSRDRRRLRAAGGRAARSARGGGRGAGPPRCSATRRFRRKGEAIPERVAEYRALGAELNVMAVRDGDPAARDRRRAAARLALLPSVAAAALPRRRGDPWQIILGARETGVTVFRPDAGVDTGPIVVQKGGVAIGRTDTAASLYFDKLYPLGVEAIARGGRRGRPRDARSPRAGRGARELPGPRRRRGRAHRLEPQRRRDRPAGSAAAIRSPGAWALRGAGERCASSTRASRPAARRTRRRARVLGVEDGRLAVAAAAAASPSAACASAAAPRLAARARVAGASSGRAPPLSLRGRTGRRSAGTNPETYVRARPPGRASPRA